MNRKWRWIWKNNTLLGNAVCFCLTIYSSLTTFGSIIDDLPDRFREVLEDTKRATNFNTFLMTGGPSAMGNGTFRIFTYVF